MDGYWRCWLISGLVSFPDPLAFESEAENLSISGPGPGLVLVPSPGTVSWYSKGAFPISHTWYIHIALIQGNGVGDVHVDYRVWEDEDGNEGLTAGQWYFPVVRNRKETEISLLGVDEDGGKEGMRGLIMRLMKIGDDERHSVGLPYWPSWLLSNSGVEHFCKWRKFLVEEHYKVWSKYKIALNFFPISMHCTLSWLHTTQTSEKCCTAMCYCSHDIMGKDDASTITLGSWHGRHCINGIAVICRSDKDVHHL